MEELINFNLSERIQFYLFYFLILIFSIMQSIYSLYNLTQYDFQVNGIEYSTIGTTINENLICSSWHSSSYLVNYLGLKKNGRPYFSQQGKEAIFYNTITTRYKTEGIIYGINLKNGEDNQEYIISFGNNQANFELYNFNNEPAEIFSKDGTSFFSTNYNSFSQVSIFNLKSSKDSYIFAFIANDNDEHWTKAFFFYKIEFNIKDINNDIQIIQKTRVENAYDAHISSCFETETETKEIFCFYAITETTLRIIVFKFESDINILDQMNKEREYWNEDLFYKCVHINGNMGAFLFYKTQNEIIISFIKYDNNIKQIKEILLNNNGYSNDIRHSDFIKLSDRKICLFSVSSSFEEIKIIIIKNYEGELFQLKEYKLNIYEKNRLKIIGGLKTTIFNGFIAMTLTAQLNYNSI